MAGKSLAQLLDECTERCRNMDAPLSARLKTLADDVRGLSAEFADVVDRMITRLKESGAGERAPQAGEPMPDFMLPDQTGQLVRLTDLTSRGPVVLAFHRGHWCPYCRISAGALAAIYGEIRSLGAELVAITPEMEQFNAELRGDTKAAFPILSDMDNGYALMLSLAFFVGDEKRRAMIAAGWDIAPYQGGENWTLPIPATFVVGRDGLVKARFIDPDYRFRMGTEAILSAVKSAQSPPLLSP